MLQRNASASQICRISNHLPPCLRRTILALLYSTCLIGVSVFDLQFLLHSLRLGNIGVVTQLCPWPYSTTTPKPDFTYTPLWISSASVINRVSKTVSYHLYSSICTVSSDSYKFHWFHPHADNHTILRSQRIAFQHTKAS